MLGNAMWTRTLGLLIALLIAAPAAAQKLPTLGTDEPGLGGDAVLPAGYKDLRWGISPRSLMAVRGRAMETQNTSDPHLSWLIETPPPGESGGRTAVKWKFWDDKLIEVHVYFVEFPSRREGEQLMHKFQERYGDSKFERIMKDVDIHGFDSLKKQPIAEERWTWQDPFTIQVLRRVVDDEQWTQVRQSRVYEAKRLLQDKKDRAEARSERVRSIELD